MTCAEFQKVLPYIIETGGKPEEEEHLRECSICSDLVQDLKYIAEQAKLLVPMEDPPAKVWDGIKGSLEREGMIRPARARGRLLGPITWISALGVIILLAFGIFVFQRNRVHRQAVRTEAQPVTVLQTASLNNIATDQDDEQVLDQLDAIRPDARQVFADNFKLVNASIADTRKSLEQNPADSDARQALDRAYEQKAMMYELATRSTR
jgi:hypothetical protein